MKYKKKIKLVDGAAAGGNLGGTKATTNTGMSAAGYSSIASGLVNVAGAFTEGNPGYGGTLPGQSTTQQTVDSVVGSVLPFYDAGKGVGDIAKQNDYMQTDKFGQLTNSNKYRTADTIGMFIDPAGSFISGLTGEGWTPQQRADKINEQGAKNKAEYDQAIEKRRQSMMGRNIATPNIGYGVAKHGMMNYKNSLDVEVEGNELKLRKGTRGYEVVREYKGPSHEGGGIDTKLREGDIVIPKDKRNEVLGYLQSGRHDLVDNVVNSLPVVSTDGRKALNGAIGDPKYGMLGTGESDYLVTDVYKPFYRWNPDFGAPVKQPAIDVSYKPDVTPKYLEITTGGASPDLTLAQITNTKETHPVYLNDYEPLPTEKRPSWFKTHITEPWNDMETTDKVNTVGAIASGLYNVGNLIASYTRTKTPYKDFQVPAQPQTVEPSLVRGDVSPTREAMRSQADVAMNTQLGKLAELGINPVVAGQTIAGQRTGTELEISAKMSQLQNEINRINAEMTTRASELNATQRNQYNTQLAQLRQQYDQYVQQAKAQENLAVSQERQANAQGVLDALQTYYQNKVASEAIKNKGTGQSFNLNFG